MMEENITAVIGFVAGSLELIGVAVIALAFVHALGRGLWHFGQKRAGVYDRLRVYIGQALLLGLEFLVAADIIRTVTMESTREGIMTLGLLVVLRIALGWSIAVEVEGCWPWQAAGKEKSAIREQ